MKISHVCALCVLVAPAVFAQACDPEQAAMNVFKKQGLVVLKPARDYVAPGGLVSLKSGAPRYREPLDDVPTDPRVAVKFRSVIMEEAGNRTVGLGLALDKLTGIVPMPVGVAVDTSRSVSLAQIDTTGVRLVADAVDAQIIKAKTAAKIKELISGGSRVFIVQEVYSGSSLDLKATTNAALNVSLGAAGEAKACDAAANGSAGKSTDEASVPKGSKPQNSAAKSAPPGAAAAETSTAGSMGIGVQVCKAGSATLRMKAENPIPFAVRLAEVELKNGMPSIKEGKFKFPTSLGDSKVEKLTSTAVPAIAGLERDK
jgi:hypothetical protein